MMSQRTAWEFQFSSVKMSSFICYQGRNGYFCVPPAALGPFSHHNLSHTLVSKSVSSSVVLGFRSWSGVGEMAAWVQVEAKRERQTDRKRKFRHTSVIQYLLRPSEGCCGVPSQLTLRQTSWESRSSFWPPVPCLLPVWSADLTRGEARLEKKEGNLTGRMKEDRGMLSP